MAHTHEELVEYIPDLRRYVKSRIQSDWWEDVVQDTLLYLFMMFDKLLITDMKGLMINTSQFFINKHHTSQKKYTFVVITTDQFSVDPNVKYTIGEYNGFKMSDELYNSIHRVSKTLFVPFTMQIDGQSIRKIASELGLNENTVKTRIKRCKEYLKKENEYTTAS